MKRTVTQGEIWDYDVIHFANLATVALQNGVGRKEHMWRIILGVLEDLEASDIRSHRVFSYKDIAMSSFVLARQEVQFKTAGLIEKLVVD